MTFWLLFILAVIILHYALSIAVSTLNIKALSTTLPKEFEDTFDSEKYRESQEYTTATTHLRLVEDSVSTALTIGFLLLGGFNVIDRFARSFQFSEIVTGIIFAFSLLFLSFLSGLPFSIYSTFRIESRFGFNRTSVKTFVLDIAKGLLLAVAIGAPILALVLWFFENSGSYGWLFCWIGVIIIGFLLQFLAPVLIMPLFNKFTPLDDTELKQKIRAYANREKFQIKGIFTMDGSKRSSKLNAFFTGFGRFRKIVFFDTLLEKLSSDEIIAVLAHEMGHFKKKHIWKMLAAGILQTGLMFFLLSFFINNEGLFQAFRMENLSIYASLVFFAFIYSPLNTLISIFLNYLSRIHEFEADRYAAETTGNPEMLIQGLKKLCRENLSNLTPHPLMVFLSYSHPPVLSRIRTLDGMINKQT
ncbi:MAG: M48 family metallopeptidase [Desulfocapsaceae bacterium]|jgi:STE24 endopeptidase|nr:M48 family metallopeptidase [Desulfocapsaceae bacterium]